jgi:uncharacterized cofD-like protein
MDITAEVRGLDPANPLATQTVRGQVAVATTEGQIVSVALDPPDPEACPEAVEAVRNADWVVLGPGSWFTSVIPHLMVPALREALGQTTGRVVVVLNLAPQAGETGGFGPEDHLAALFEHAPGLKVHTVLADPGSLTGLTEVDELERTVASYGARLVVDDVAMGDGTHRHDPEKLARAYASIFEEG